MLPWESGRMKSLIVKHSVFVKNHKTSISLEDDFWKGLKKIAESRKQNVYHLIDEIDRKRKFANLSSAIRLFVLQSYKDQIGHRGRIAK
jgi:predicted DNA-binding ribbon-helix-helix protein